MNIRKHAFDIDEDRQSAEDFLSEIKSKVRRASDQGFQDLDFDDGISYTVNVSFGSENSSLSTFLYNIELLQDFCRVHDFELDISIDDFNGTAIYGNKVPTPEERRQLEIEELKKAEAKRKKDAAAQKRKEAQFLKLKAELGK
jgi:hypothetical protein